MMPSTLMSGGETKRKAAGFSIKLSACYITQVACRCERNPFRFHCEFIWNAAQWKFHEGGRERDIIRRTHGLTSVLPTVVKSSGSRGCLGILTCLDEGI